MRRSTMSSSALGRGQEPASCGSRPRRSASSDAGSRRRSCRCIPRRPTPGGRSCTPSSFISSSLSIGSVPRASARLTTTRSTTARAHDRRDVLDRADDAGVEQRRADLRRIGIDEADDLDAELVAAREELARQVDGRGAGADEQQPLARPDPAAQPLEDHAPADRPASITRTAAIRNTPRPMMSAGNQKYDDRQHERGRWPAPGPGG